MRKMLLGLFGLCLFALPAWAADAVPTVTPEDHVLGKADAPITIVEYASLTCPHCARFDAQVLPKIRENWIDTGKAKLVFRDFPLDGLALRAALVTHCAPADRYFGFVDALFRNQSVWVQRDEQKAKEGLERIARLGGIGEKQVESCLKDEKAADAIAAEAQKAENAYGVESTPTFFINGTTKLVGEQPYSEFEKALTAAQAKS